MSHEATNWAVKQRGLKPATKIVLWHLADRYHPDHGCFPKQNVLAYDCEISIATLNRHLTRLEEFGLLIRVKRVDLATMQQDSTLYILACNPEFSQHADGPTLNMRDGIADSQKEPIPTLNLRDYSKTVREPVSTRGAALSSVDSFHIREILGVHAEPVAVLSFYQFRKTIKKPLTVTAAKRIAKTLEDIKSQGGNPTDALGLCEEKGWQSIRPDWYYNAQAGNARTVGGDKDLEEFERLARE